MKRLIKKSEWSSKKPKQILEKNYLDLLINLNHIRAIVNGQGLPSKDENLKKIDDIFDEIAKIRDNINEELDLREEKIKYEKGE